jgi:hypothetical protein
LRRVFAVAFLPRLFDSTRRSWAATIVDNVVISIARRGMKRRFPDEGRARYHPPMALHIIKLVVGCDTIDDLLAWHKTGEPWIMNTRMTPKRVDEVLDGGSLYRVFKGQILCRQKILAIDTIGAGPASRCEVTVDPPIIRVVPTPRRAFQGWRYLTAADAPEDLGEGETADMPQDLARQLRELGAW